MVRCICTFSFEVQCPFQLTTFGRYEEIFRPLKPILSMLLYDIEERQIGKGVCMYVQWDVPRGRFAKIKRTIVQYIYIFTMVEY